MRQPAVALLVGTILLGSACSLIKMDRRPAHPVEFETFACTRSRIPAWVDVALASLGGVATLLGVWWTVDAGSRPTGIHRDSDIPPWIGVGLAGAALFSVTAWRGFVQARRCRALTDGDKPLVRP